MEFSAVILAGGRSSRIGSDKAFLPFQGDSLLVHQLQTVTALEPAEVYVSGRPGIDYRSFGVPALMDSRPDHGPLAGVERALESAATPLVLVLAVDMPFMTPRFLRGLLDRCRSHQGLVPQIGRYREPLAAIYPKSAHGLALEVLCADRSMQTLIRRCAAAGLVSLAPFPAACAPLFANWNQPADVVPS